MKNRLPDNLSDSAPHVPRSSAAAGELLRTAQKQFNRQRQWVETSIQKHPAIGIGAALCIGVIIGWISKRR